MKKLFLTLIACLTVTFSFAGSILLESFEYANHDMTVPVGWTSNDESWVCGYLEKDHNRVPHTGNWYAFTQSEESWMFMPMYLLESIQYRFTCWAISDGNYLLEFWAGPSANSASMHTLLLSASVESGVYEYFSSYVETIPEGCKYVGIRAVANAGASFLTIDDIEVDMVEQYTFEAEAITGDTVLFPGSQATFRYLIHNTGYDPVDITMHPSHEYFTDFSFYANGMSGTTVPTEPDETVEVTVYATLRPEVEPGTVAWLDIQMTIPCNCNTAMVTFWVTPLDITGVSEESTPSICVFPNPTSDFVTIEAEGLQLVRVIDATGRTIKSVPANGNTLQLDLTGLKAGTYFISAKTRSTSSFVKPILKM
jgi:hypothetical protein